MLPWCSEVIIYDGGCSSVNHSVSVNSARAWSKACPLDPWCAAVGMVDHEGDKANVWEVTKWLLQEWTRWPWVFVPKKKLHWRTQQQRVHDHDCISGPQRWVWREERQKQLRPIRRTGLGTWVPPGERVSRRCKLRADWHCCISLVAGNPSWRHLNFQTRSPYVGMDFRWPQIIDNVTAPMFIYIWVTTPLF